MSLKNPILYQTTVQWEKLMEDLNILKDVEAAQ